MRRITSALMIIAAIAAPLAVPARAHADERHERNEHAVRAERAERARHRIYDPYRHDYHVWNAHERQAYRRYLAQRHRARVTYQRQTAAGRRAYWRWRHAREERLEHR